MRPAVALTAAFALAAAGAVVAGTGTASASGGVQATYTASQTLPVPPASSFAGAGGGDGWAVAVGATQVFNVFHHNGVLTVACHEQSDASDCYTPRTLTDSGAHNFGTSGHPGMRLDQATGKLYVYATRDDNTAGVVCVDTTIAATNPDPFCGFTALTAVGDASYSLIGMSSLSEPVQVGTKLYSFNYVSGAVVTGAENTLLCFDLATHAACAGQPFAVSLGTGTYDDYYFPEPQVAAINGRVIVSSVSHDAGDVLGCFDPATGTNCTGSWPVAAPAGYTSSYGAPFPLLSSSGSVLGFCLPDGTDECYALNGSTLATPAGMPAAVLASDGWNGPGLVLGPRVYLANGNQDQVYCYDASTDAECTNFPKALPGAGYQYTVNPDPARPTCIWVNADNGSAQIQNFDAYTAGGCGEGPIRVLASSFVVGTSVCTPTSFVTLQITDPPPSGYTSGSVSFEDSDGNPISGLSDLPLDGTGSVDLRSLHFPSSAGLPQFLITLVGTSGTPHSVTAQLTWTSAADPSCAGPGTTVVNDITLTPATGNGTVGSPYVLTATVNKDGSPESGKSVVFTVTSGPDSGFTRTFTTAANGTAQFTVVGAGAGTDQVSAAFVDDSSNTQTATASISWNGTNPGPHPATGATTITLGGAAYNKLQSGGCGTLTVTGANGVTTAVIAKGLKLTFPVTGYEVQPSNTDAFRIDHSGSVTLSNTCYQITLGTLRLTNFGLANQATTLALSAITRSVDDHGRQVIGTLDLSGASTTWQTRSNGTTRTTISQMKLLLAPEGAQELNQLAVGGTGSTGPFHTGQQVGSAKTRVVFTS
jgi:hypothetical protein